MKVCGRRKVMVVLLRPKKGGFLRPFGCGWFIREYLLGHAPYGSPSIDPQTGATQADMFYHYKNALIRETAIERATRQEERLAKRSKRPISPDNIDRLMERHLIKLPYKSTGCRYHSFVVYFSNLQRLGWLEFTGRKEHSEFQDYYSRGQSRKYYRLSPKGIAASEAAWTNPLAALYGHR
jgi:hypothetical protein